MAALGTIRKRGVILVCIISFGRKNQRAGFPEAR